MWTDYQLRSLLQASSSRPMTANGSASVLPEEEDQSSESSTDDSSTGSEAVTDEGSGTARIALLEMDSASDSYKLLCS